jgi:uracil-DNA glycosylase
MFPLLFNEFALLGVLMLNTVLTVKAHNAKSHADQGWETLTDAAIKKVGSFSKRL